MGHSGLMILLGVFFAPIILFFPDFKETFIGGIIFFIGGLIILINIVLLIFKFLKDIFK